MCQTSVNLTPCCIKVPSGTKVPRLDMCRSILSLGRIAHQMWYDHPFSQRNWTTERTIGVEVGGCRKVRERELDKI